jgi:hypothetical protein
MEWRDQVAVVTGGARGWAIAFVVPYAAVFFAFAVYSGERRLTKPPNHASSDFALPSDGLLPLGAALFGPAPP